jgi:hypothetical protein
MDRKLFKVMHLNIHKGNHMDEEKERLAKVCIDRMDRELKKGLPPMWYLGYITGILDVLWDYDRKLWERVARLKIEKIIK